MFIAQQYAQNIVDEMKAAIHRDINIMDENGVILASTNPARRGLRHRGAEQVLQDRLSFLTIWENNPASGDQWGINLPITLDDQTIGVIGITGDPNEVSVFGDIIKRMTEIMVEGARQQEQLDLMDRAKSLFLEAWLFAQTPDWSELEIRGRLLGFDIDAPYTVALLQLPNHDPGGYARAEDLGEMRNSLILRTIRNHIQDNSKQYCAVVRDKIMVLLCHSTRGEAYSKISKMCQDIESYHAIKIGAGISDSSKNPMDIRRCYLEAQTATAVAAQSSTHRVVFYDEVSLEFIVRSIPKAIKQDLQKMIFASCTPTERAEFTQTIKLFFDEDGDIKRCADKMFVHRNTVQYRMDRLQKKTGYHLKIPKDALLLYLTVQ